MIRRALLWLLAVLLVASALGAVTAQHRARGLFVELEREHQRARQLKAEGERLRVELARAAQPAAVEAAARAQGLKPVDAAHTVYLPALPSEAAK
jgi:cell division protein FtsL